MSKIRKLYYFDKKNVRKMISFLNNGTDDTYVNHIMFNPLLPLHSILPLNNKFLPESYILKDNKDIKSIITVAPTKCPLKQMEIQKLLFEDDAYEAAGELIQYVVSKYKARGTASFIVKIDDYLQELIRLFTARCGFSQISYERLWKVKHIKRKKYNKKIFRHFRTSDAQVVANLYNDLLLPHFRPLLSKEKKEFEELFFKGLSYYNEYKYILEDRESKSVLAYISIQTSDNVNYIVDFLTTGWSEIDIDVILSFIKDQIRKRKKRYHLYIRTQKYNQLGEKYENDFRERGFECIKNQAVLTNSSAKIIKDTEREGRFTVLTQFYSGVRVTN